MVSLLPGYFFNIFISYCQKKKEGENEPRFTWQILRRSYSHRKLKTEIKYNTFCNKPANDT
jgi:uncharacterized protein YneF (UPF0154 family)